MSIPAQSTHCQPGESIFEATKRLLGNGYHVDPWHRVPGDYKPNPKEVKEHGEPVAVVTVRPRESYFVYRD